MLLKTNAVNFRLVNHKLKKANWWQELLLDFFIQENHFKFWPIVIDMLLFQICVLCDLCSKIYVDHSIGV